MCFGGLAEFPCSAARRVDLAKVAASYRSPAPTAAAVFCTFSPETELWHLSVQLEA